MKIEGHVLKMKLTPPPVKKHMLRRPQLTRRLRRIPDYPFTLVHAGPGYGKSTALSGFFRSSGLSFAWYGISSQDDDLIPFVLHIVHAIRQTEHGFGELLLSSLQKAEHNLGENDIYTLADMFLNELIGLRNRMILVLDDYHAVEHNKEIDRWVQYLLRYLPDCETLRIVIMSRTRPDWGSLPLLKLRNDMQELTKDDLAFNEEEIEVLFADNYECPLDKAQIKHIHEKTEGWVIAIQLFWQRLLSAGRSVSSVFHAPSDTMDDLFCFLALELFQKLDSSLQLFMLQTSLFDVLSGEWCDAICERKHSHELLLKISSSNLFLVQIDERQFRYHALFRDFLSGELRKQPGLFEELHRKAARYFIDRNKNEYALLHLEAVRDTGETARLLETHGAEMIRRGQLEHLLQCIERIPGLDKRKYPILYIYQGEIYRYRCVYDKAMSSYCEGEKIACGNGDEWTQIMSLEGQSQLYLDTIQPGKAELLLQKAIGLLEKSDRKHVCDRRQTDMKRAVRLYGLMTENLINAGRGSEAERWYSRCLSLDGEFADILLEARLRLRTGRLQEAKKALERGKRMDAAAAHQTLTRSHREIDLLVSLIDSMCGDPLSAKMTAETGMMQGIQLNAPFAEACGWMRMGHAAQLLGKYDTNVALNCYTTALTMMERLEIPRGKAEPLMGLCLLYGRERSTDLALQYGHLALAETEKVSDAWLSALIRLSMGISVWYGQRNAEAAAIFQECVRRFENCGDRFGLAISALWLAMNAYRMEEEEEFARTMALCLQQMEEGDYSFIFSQRTLFGPSDTQQFVPLLLEANRLGLQKSYVASLLASLGIDQLSYHPGYTLRIETLGGLRVWLGDEELGDKDWQRGKAKELFQLLVTKRQHPLAKEEIFSMLLPQPDEKSANRDFKVALNALNSALEPHRRARTNPYFIVRSGSAYQLHAGAAYQLDAVEFEQRMKNGLEAEHVQEAVDALEQGLSMYKGDYMPDRRYDDWCIEERERLQVLFLRGAERLAQLYTDLGQYNKAIRWCEVILQKDSCWEEAYRLLMHCHLQLNNRHQAIKWYRKCVDVLQEELGIEPMPQTKQFYRKLKDEDSHVTHL